MDYTYKANNNKLLNESSFTIEEFCYDNDIEDPRTFIRILRQLCDFDDIEQADNSLLRKALVKYQQTLKESSDYIYKAKIGDKLYLQGNSQDGWDTTSDPDEAAIFESKTEPTQIINQMKKDGKISKNDKITVLSESISDFKGHLLLGTAVLGIGTLTAIDHNKAKLTADKLGIELAETEYGPHKAAGLVGPIYEYKYGMKGPMNIDSLCEYLKNHTDYDEITYEDEGDNYVINYTDNYAIHQTAANATVTKHRTSKGNLNLPKEYFDVSFVLDESKTALFDCLLEEGKLSKSIKLNEGLFGTNHPTLREFFNIENFHCSSKTQFCIFDGDKREPDATLVVYGYDIIEGEEEVQPYLDKRIEYINFDTLDKRVDICLITQMKESTIKESIDPTGAAFNLTKLKGYLRFETRWEYDEDYPEDAMLVDKVHEPPRFTVNWIGPEGKKHPNTYCVNLRKDRGESWTWVTHFCLKASDAAEMINLEVSVWEHNNEPWRFSESKKRFPEARVFSRSSRLKETKFSKETIMILKALNALGGKAKPSTIYEKAFGLPRFGREAELDFKQLKSEGLIDYNKNTIQYELTNKGINFLNLSNNLKESEELFENVLNEARVFSHSSGFGLSGHYNDYEAPRKEPLYIATETNEDDGELYFDEKGNTTEFETDAKKFTSEEDALEFAKNNVIFGEPGTKLYEKFEKTLYKEKNTMKNKKFKFIIEYNTGDYEWDNYPLVDDFNGTWEELEDYLKTTFDSEDRERLLKGDYIILDDDGDSRIYIKETVNLSKENKLFENSDNLFNYVLNESSLKENISSLEWLLDKAYVSEYRMVGKNSAEVRVRHTPELLTSESMAARFDEDIPDGYRLEVDYLGEDPILGRNFDIYEVQLIKD